MQLKITGWLGAPDREFPIKGITVFRAPNASGKTSILRAVQAVLTDGNPLGLSASVRDHYRKDDKKNDTCISYEGAAGSVTLRHPMTIKSEGLRPTATPVALALADLLSPKTQQKRADAWKDVVLLKPQEADLREAFKLIGEEERKYLIKTILEDGWDHAHGLYKGRLKEHKATWSRLVAECDGVSETWGARKAETWRPEGWDETVNLTQEGCEKALAEAKTQFNVLLESRDAATQAATKDKLAQDLRDVNAKVSQEAGFLSEDKARLDAAWKEKTAWDNKMNTLNRKFPAMTHALCQECGTYLKEGKLAPDQDAAKAALAEEHAARQEEIDKFNEKDKAMKAEFHKAMEALREAEKVHGRRAKEVEGLERDRETLKRTIAGLPQAPEKDITEDDLQMAQTAVRQAERELAMVKCMKDIQKVNGHLDNLAGLIEKLGPHGLRAQIRKERMQDIMDGIAKLNGDDSWKVELDEETLQVTVGGRPVEFCSSSEQLWAELIIRGAIAMNSDSEVFVLDNLDVFDLDRAKKAFVVMFEMVRSARKTLACICAVVDDDSGDTLWQTSNDNMVVHQI